MIEQNSTGKVPKPGALQPQDTTLARQAEETIGEVLELYNQLGFSRALELVWALIAGADKYLAAEKPWALGDSADAAARRATVLWTAAEALRVVTALTYPILPESTVKVWALLGQREQLAAVPLDQLRWGQLAPGTSLGKSLALFPRIDKTEAIERMEAMENEAQRQPPPTAATAPAAAAATGSPAAAGATPAATPERIGIEDFSKVEMRVGQVKTAERIVGADKLLKLTVDIGTEIRQICAGIAQFYEPDTLIGRKVVVVTNLAPRKLRGVESNGMIVAASVGPEGRPVLAGFAEDVEVGARLK